ncbi:MAG: LysM peptidoglycan-binding domain-containing protein [Aggregatilineales bacterium]
MPRNRLMIALFFIMGLLSVMISATGAQDTTTTTGNLLSDPGFEFEGVWKRVATGSAEGDGGTTFNVAPSWEGWYTESPRSASWQNRLPNGFPRSNAGFGFVRSGNRSQEIARGEATFTAAVYQSVAVPEGTNVIASAWFVMNIAGAEAANANSQARVGIDPNGGSNPFDVDVVWSDWGRNQLSSNGFRQLTVSATSTGTAVTIFLYATQTVPTEGNGIYWDDASVTIGGAGGTAGGGQNVSGTPIVAATLVPTAPPLAPFVNAQGASNDGSIIHIVQAGDTLDAISVAYGVPRDEIVALNNLASIRFLSIGQEIIIRPPQANTSNNTDEEETDDEGDEADATPTRRATSTRTSQQSSSTDDEEDTVATEEVAETEEVVETDEVDDEPTVEPTETPIPATSTPAPTAPVAVADTSQNVDPSAQLGVVCVTLFEDVNMNRIQDQDELYLAGGQIELNTDGTTVGAIATDDTPDPLCFDELEVGEYIALASAPSGYGLTTSDQLRLRVQPGSTLNVAFGAAEGVTVAEVPEADANDLAQEVAVDSTPEEDDNSDLLAISGLIVFGLAGLTLIGGLGAMLLLRRR